MANQDLPRRAATRAPIGKKVRLQYDDSTEIVDGLCGNISIGGMYVSADDARPQGTLVRFELVLDDVQTVRGLGEVVWMRPESAGSTHAAGMGVKFRYLEQRDRQLIFKLVSQHIKERLTKPGSTTKAPPTAVPGPGPSLAPPPRLRGLEVPASKAAPPKPVRASRPAPPKPAPTPKPAPPKPAPPKPAPSKPAPPKPAPAPKPPAPAPKPAAAALPQEPRPGATPPQQEGQLGLGLDSIARATLPDLDELDDTAPAMRKPSAATKSPVDEKGARPAAPPAAEKPTRPAAPVAVDKPTRPAAPPKAPEAVRPVTTPAAEKVAPSLVSEAVLASASAPEPKKVAVVDTPEPAKASPGLADQDKPAAIDPEPDLFDSGPDAVRAEQRRDFPLLPVLVVVLVIGAAALYLLRAKLFSDVTPPPPALPMAQPLDELPVDASPPVDSEPDDDAGTTPSPSDGTGTAGLPSTTTSPPVLAPPPQAAPPPPAAPPPRPAPVPPPTPPAATTPSAATGAAFTRLTDIRWSSTASGGTKIILTANGDIVQGRYKWFELTNENPRVVVRLLGARQGYGPSPLNVGSAAVRQIRTGFHRKDSGDELHIVIDLEPGHKLLGDLSNVGSTLEIEIGPR